MSDGERILQRILMRMLIVSGWRTFLDEESLAWLCEHFDDSAPLAGTVRRELQSAGFIVRSERLDELTAASQEPQP